MHVLQCAFRNFFSSWREEAGCYLGGGRLIRAVNLASGNWAPSHLQASTDGYTPLVYADTPSVFLP